jgi:hypothetical protein
LQIVQNMQKRPHFNGKIHSRIFFLKEKYGMDLCQLETVFKFEK